VVESTYNWYWLVDGLMEHGYRVHLANTTWSGKPNSTDATRPQRRVDAGARPRDGENAWRQPAQWSCAAPVAVARASKPQKCAPEGKPGGTRNP
jgi:hypothetical protein